MRNFSRTPNFSSTPSFSRTPKFPKAPNFSKLTNSPQIPICLLVLCMLDVQSVVADDGPFNATASIQGVSESNFSRSPLSDAEQTLLSSAGLGFDDTFGRQRLIAKWRGHHYQYDKHPDFDGTTQSVQIAWKGLIGSQINTDVEWLRDSNLVDRLEFFGKDIVNRDDFHARLGYGNDHKLSFHLGGRKSNQTHSNNTRTSLDFDEDEAFVDAGYQTNNKSSVFVRVRSGSRTYVHPALDSVPGSLDFDYEQVELEGIWAISPKTNLSATVASFKRDGAINEVSGSLATLAADWQTTEKIKFDAGYTLRQPAVGETSDSPSQVQNIFASVAWQYSAKISIGSLLRYSLVDYDNASPELIRSEHLYIWSPFTLSYSSGNHWLIRLDSGWRKNESPLAYRNYVSRQISLGLFFNY